MLTTLVTIAAILAVAIAVVLIMAASKPDEFRVARSIDIQAPPEKIFPLINDFHAWRGWSPYENKDPAMKRSFSGPQSGKGAVYAWEGDKNVGQGSMKIADTTPPSKIVLNLDFERPFKASNIVEYTLAPRGGDTNVTWAMYGPVPFMAKIMHVFMNMDKMCGDDFEIGLANMKAMAEKQGAPQLANV